MTQGENHSAAGVHTSWPSAPRLTQVVDLPVKSPSLSFRSPSGKRLHPRVALPASVEIAGAQYAISDVSLGGFALEGEGPPAQLDDPFRGHLPHRQADLTLAIEATAKVRRLSRGAAKSFQIIEMSPDAAVALDRLVAIWLSGSESLADALSRSSLEAPEPAQSQSRNWRSVAVFGAGLRGAGDGGGLRRFQPVDGLFRIRRGRRADVDGARAAAGLARAAGGRGRPLHRARPGPGRTAPEPAAATPGRGGNPDPGAGGALAPARRRIDAGRGRLPRLPRPGRGRADRGQRDAAPHGTPGRRRRSACSTAWPG
jgi:hypothetical protein